jgi:hypothetical protein
VVDKKRRADRTCGPSRDRQLAQGFRAHGLHRPGRDELLGKELADRARVTGRALKMAFASSCNTPRPEVHRSQGGPALRYGVVPGVAAVVATGLVRPVGLPVVMEREGGGHREQVTDQEQPSALPPSRSIHRSTGGAICFCLL